MCLSTNFTSHVVNQARKSWHENFRHGAILFDGRQILSTGYNRPIVSKNIFNSIHAEMAAIINAKSFKKFKKRQNLTMFVVRINKHDSLCNSKPCMHCQKIMKTYGVHKCLFSTSSGEIDYMLL